MSYSWYNIGKDCNKKKLPWRKKAGTLTTLTFPDGVYDDKDIKNYIQAHTHNQGGSRTRYHSLFQHDHLPGCYYDGYRL